MNFSDRLQEQSVGWGDNLNDYDKFKRLKEHADGLLRQMANRHNALASIEVKEETDLCASLRQVYEEGKVLKHGGIIYEITGIDETAGRVAFSLRGLRRENEGG